MSIRIRPSLLTAIFLLVCGGILSALYLWRVSQDATAADLLSRIPVENATVLFADMEALRGSGLLELLAGTGIDSFGV